MKSETMLQPGITLHSLCAQTPARERTPCLAKKAALADASTGRMMPEECDIVSHNIRETILSRAECDASTLNIHGQMPIRRLIPWAVLSGFRFHRRLS